MRLSPARIAAMLVIVASDATAQAPTYLAPAEVARVIADGRPWNVAAAGRPDARMTLNRDGTGTFGGPITMPVNWRFNGNAFCIETTFADTKCLQYKPIAGGYEGYANGKLDLTLKR